MSKHALAAVAVGCAIAAMLLLVSGAWAADDTATIDVPCGPLSDMKDRSLYREMTHDEFTAARVSFYLAPGTPAQLPPGESALTRALEDGSASIVFVDGDEACAPMHMLKQGVEMLRKIRDGVVTHPAGRM